MPGIAEDDDTFDPNTDENQALDGQDAAAPAASDTPKSQDLDDIAEAEIRAALEAEERAATGNAEGGGEVGPQGREGQGEQPQGQAGEQPRDEQGRFIPKARFDEEAQRRREAEQERDAERLEKARLMGRIEAMQMARGQGQPAAQGQPQGQQQPAQITPEQAIAQIKEERKSLAAKFDAGEITASEWEAQRELLDEKRDQIRDAMRAPQRDAQPQQPTEDLYLRERTAQLEATYPIVNALEADSDWAVIADITRSRLAGQGIRIDMNLPDHRLYWREQLSVTADQVGPGLLAARGIQWTPPQQQTQGQPGKPAMSPDAQARARKLELQANMPPQFGAGVVSAGAEAVTESQISSYTEDQWDALPQSVKDKILGVGA